MSPDNHKKLIDKLANYNKAEAEKVLTQNSRRIPHVNNVDHKLAEWVNEYLQDIDFGEKPPTGICGSCGKDKPIDPDYLCRECREAHDLADSM